MTPVLLAGVGLLGGVGAIARFGLDASIGVRFGRELPLGTLVVNLLGAFLLGLITGIALDDDGSRLLGTGAIGAFTTFSTWALESQRLAEAGQARLGGLNLLVSLFAGIAVAALGRALGTTL
jgi:fluoride exporter